MPAVDPRSSDAVAEVIRARAAAQWGDVRLVEAASSVGEGFDSYIHLVHLAGGALPDEWREPLVVRLLPSADREEQAQREAATQRWARAQGYPAPDVLDVLGPDDGIGLPAQVMERAPGTTMLDALKARPWRAVRLVDQLAGLQLALHALPVATWTGQSEARVLVEKRLALPRRVATELGDTDLARALERADAVIPVAIGGEHVLCHGDFHPLNVMVAGDTATVIDWTDAGLGPREADVARTLLLVDVVSIVASNALERAVLAIVGPRLSRRYRATYTAGVALDEPRMRAWRALHALHGWSQVMMLHAGRLDGVSSAQGERVPLSLAAYLRSRFDEALT